MQDETEDRILGLMRELKEARDDTGRERERRCALHIAVRDFIANPRKNAAALADQHPDIAAALAGSMPPPAPPLPPGSHGVTMRVLSVDPPVALLEFEPGGVLGEDVHPEHEELITLISGSADVTCELWNRRPIADDARRSLCVGPNQRHHVRSGSNGSLVLVAMAPAKPRGDR
jgi:quercetin dioxygenase-like cupin family protein